MGGNGNIRHNLATTLAEVLDGGNERHIEPALGQEICQTARHIEDQLSRRGQLVQVMDQRLGVQVSNSADTNRSFHHFTG